MDYEKEISFGAFDSELMHQEIFIPEGFTATIEGNRIVLTRTESEDDRIRKELLDFCKNRAEKYPNDPKYSNIGNWIAWLEKQGEQKPAWKPSDEQIVVLELASKYERVFTPKEIDILIGLKVQLKKLKGH